MYMTLSFLIREAQYFLHITFNYIIIAVYIIIIKKFLSDLIPIKTAIIVVLRLGWIYRYYDEIGCDRITFGHNIGTNKTPMH